MASKTISLEEPLVAALQRFAAAQGCSWVIMRFSNDALQLSVENSGDFDGFRCAMQALDNGSGACAPAFAVLKVQLSEAKGGREGGREGGCEELARIHTLHTHCTSHLHTHTQRKERERREKKGRAREIGS
jgi:hypothetical protein